MFQFKYLILIFDAIKTKIESFSYDLLDKRRAHTQQKIDTFGINSKCNAIAWICVFFSTIWCLLDWRQIECVYAVEMLNEMRFD